MCDSEVIQYLLESRLIRFTFSSIEKKIHMLNFFLMFKSENNFVK